LAIPRFLALAAAMLFAARPAAYGASAPGLVGAEAMVEQTKLRDEARHDETGRRSEFPVVEDLSPVVAVVEAGVTSTPASLLTLQRDVGNAAVGRLLERTRLLGGVSAGERGDEIDGGTRVFLRSADPNRTRLTSRKPTPTDQQGLLARDGTPDGSTPAPADGGQSPGASLVSDPAFESLVEAMEADGDEADTTWQSQVDDGVFSFFAPEVQAQYAADGTDCDKARGDFNLEWNKIVGGNGDPNELLAAYEIYSLRIRALQQANARVGALITIDFANYIKPVLAIALTFKTFDLAIKLEKRLKKLEEDLEEATHELHNVEKKLAANAAVSIVTLVLTPEAALAKLCLAGGGIVAHIVIDNNLGEPSVKGKVVFAVGDGGEFLELSEKGKEAIHKLKGIGGSKALGFAAMIVTGILDGMEIGKEMDLVNKIKTEIDETEKEFEGLMDGVIPLGSELEMIVNIMKALPDVVNAALAAGKDAATNYDAIKHEIQRVIQEGH
jgi:hypothetical protein